MYIKLKYFNYNLKLLIVIGLSGKFLMFCVFLFFLWNQKINQIEIGLNFEVKKYVIYINICFICIL